MLRWVGRFAVVGVACIAGASLGCSRSDDAKVTTSPESSAVVATTGSAAAALPQPPKPPPPPPTLKPEVMKLDGLKGEGLSLSTIDGAVIVTTDTWVYRLLDDGNVEGVGQVPAGSKFIGPNQIRQVVGRWPEEVGVIYHSMNGRAPMPSYHPLVGGGGWYTFAPGGGLGLVAGVAYSGGTTTVAGYDMAEGHRMIKVRGPLVKPKYTVRADVGCKEVEQLVPGPKPAVNPSEYASTRAGTIVSLGEFCRTEQTAWEIWTKPADGKPFAKSRIEPVGEHWKRSKPYFTTLLRGPADTLYGVPEQASEPILRYADGKLTPLPRVPHGLDEAFVSPDGALYVYNRHALYELHEGDWKLVAETDFPAEVGSIARLGERFVTAVSGELYTLKETTRKTLDPAAEATDCKTPFLYLFDARTATPKHYRFPQTAKKMSTFTPLDAVELVDFVHLGRQRVGLRILDWKVAKELWSHVRETMPDEPARLICFDPKEPRTIEVRAAAPAK